MDSMRATSLRSIKSAKSELLRSGTQSETGVILDFDEFIQQAVVKFDCPVSVAVGKEYQRDIYTKKGKTKNEKKYTRKSKITDLVNLSDPEEDKKDEKEEPADTHTLIITTYYDIFNRLVEIQMNKFHYHPIPRVLMQLCGIFVSTHRHLNKFTLKNCLIDMYTIYELGKIVTITNLTDICLDQSPLKECNYDILLEEASNLRNLSLARCKINDVACERLAARLYHLQPAENTLEVLNLASNTITDIGAAYLGKALRTNRHLRYLNLSDNHLSDVGADYIFDVLTEFPLTRDENVEKCRQYIEYLRKKHALYNKCLAHFVYKSSDDIGKKSVKKGTSVKSKPNMKRDKSKSISEDDINVKAELMARDLLGPFEYPFNLTNVITVNGYPFCVGNLILCYINLAYNNLSYTSVQKLLAVVLHQSNFKTDKACGLLNVILDGNYVPQDCIEFKTINFILLKRVAYFENKHSDRFAKRKSTLTRAGSIDKRITLSGR